jgi:hypothetical protein
LAPGGGSQVSSFPFSGRTINDAMLVKVGEGVSKGIERLSWRAVLSTIAELLLTVIRILCPVTSS